MACYQMQCTDVDHFVGDWFDYQYFSDGHIDSGTDAHVCTEDDLRFFVIDHMWRLDIE